MKVERVDRRACFKLETDVLVAGGGAAGIAAAVTPQCFSYSHAIGHAAAMCLEAQCEPRALRGEDVRDRAERNGARLGAGEGAAR